MDSSPGYAVNCVVQYTEEPSLTMSSPGGTASVSTSTSTSTSSDVAPRAEAIAGSPAPPDWEVYKDTIKDLYMDQNLNLNQVVERMKAYNFHAT